jgi:N-acetylglucosamine malate deacetylase 1
MDQQLDVIAVGAHPDDVEIGCGGTLAELVRQGYRVGIIDLTDGEPTPGSPGPEARLDDARRAAETLGIAHRVTLDLPNRRLFDTFEARVALAKQFRRYRPQLVLGLGGATPMASPDHYQASLITDAAVFYAKLTKWDEHFDSLPPYSVPRHMNYFLSFRELAPITPNSLVIDISLSLQKKLDAIACYVTQFPPEKAHYHDRFRAFAVQLGLAAGYAAGELLGSTTAVGTQDLMGLLFGPRSK